MNGWILVGLVLVFLAVLASIALWARDKFSQIEAEKAGFKRAADKAEQALSNLVVERNVYATNYQNAQDATEVITRELKRVKAERDSLRLQLDVALKPKPARVRTKKTEIQP